jgi:hypothetical protein
MCARTSAIRRSSTWSITSTCWSTNLAHSPAANHWSSGAAAGWPVSYDQYWQALMERDGRQHGTRAMIELLQLGSRHGYDRLRSAIELALQLGCIDAAAVRHLMVTDQLAHQRPVLLLDVGELTRSAAPIERLPTH